MSVDTCKSIYADSVNEGDELDFDSDEYADNEFAMTGYALVISRVEWYTEDEPWITFETTQGEFDMPAGHKVKRKVVE